MREILFRGILKYDNSRRKRGQWVFGDLVRLQDGNDGKPHIYGYGEVFPETVGQYTGLTDKNGKKIFEGDILDHTIQAEVLTNRGVVVWDCENARWALQLNTMKPCFYMHNPKAVEVIGNIHDNPELLKECGENEI